MFDTNRQISSDLTPVQVQVLAALAVGGTISHIAEVAGIHRSTIYNWLKDPTFAAEFDKSRHEYTETLRDQLRSLAATAIDTIRQLMEDPETPPSVRLKAALAVLNREQWNLPVPLETTAEPATEPCVGVLKLAEIKEFAKRMAALPLEETPRNAPCPCGSGKKYKRCCIGGTPPQTAAA